MGGVFIYSFLLVAENKEQRQIPHRESRNIKSMEVEEMEWLTNILANVVISDDGKLDSEALINAIQRELPKHYVPKTDFNAKVKELIAANETITTLKKDNKGNEALQQTIQTHETTITNLQMENENLKKTYALKEELTKEGCSDPDYLIYKHGGLEKFKFGEDGKPTEVKTVIDTYKESIPHIFKTGQKQQNYNPPGGTGGNSTNPFAKETFNLTEQGKLFKESPEQARALAAAAGVTI